VSRTGAADLSGGRVLEVECDLAQSWNEFVLFRCRAEGDPVDMATFAQKIDTEQRMRTLLEQGGLPQPDMVEYGSTCIRLFFEDSKTVVVIDIDEPPDGTEPSLGAGAA
jgi:hypothetical protein